LKRLFKKLYLLIFCAYGTAAKSLKCLRNNGFSSRDFCLVDAYACRWT